MLGRMRTTRQKEDWICELDNWESSQVLCIDSMRDNADDREDDGEAVNSQKCYLHSDHDIDQAHEKLLCKDRVLFDQLGEVVEA